MDTDEGKITQEISISLAPKFQEPLSARTRVRTAGASHQGKVRFHNEDHYLIARIARVMDRVKTNLPDGDIPDRFEESGYAMVVADGMGGMQAGEVASRLAIRSGVLLVLNDVKWGLRMDDAEARELIGKMARHFQTVNTTVTTHAEGDHALEGMGTTLTTAYSVGAELFLVHVGDSRAYLFRDGRLRQLTRDQTLAQHLADAGQIPEEDVATHRLRHVLTNAVGAGAGRLEVETQQRTLHDGDRLLLCSDGLSDMVEDGKIAEVLGSRADPDEACAALIEAALEGGGKDNVTVVLADYTIPS